MGAALPWAIAGLAGDVFPVPPRLALYSAPLAISATYGVLTAMLFTVDA